MNKKKTIIILLALAAIFIAAGIVSRKKPTPAQEVKSSPIKVSVQSVSDSMTLSQQIRYPASIVGDQEITITAKAAGNTTNVPFNIGDKVSAGSLLARIDDTGNISGVGENGFQSSQIQQTQLSVEQAHESLDIAKKSYKDLKKAYDQQQKNSSLTQTVSKAQVNAAKGQIEVAEIQLESARVGLGGILDSHLITSPISGFITGKSVSTGDSVAVGQQIATISKTSNIKIQFFVDQDQQTQITKGMIVTATDNNGNSFDATVKNISPAADPATKRFLVEAFPIRQTDMHVLSGTIIDVSFPFIRKPNQAGNLILPLSAITIGQNESHIFINHDGHAQQVSVDVVDVAGEAAEIKADISQNSQIIIEGSKLVKDGDAVQLQ